MTKNVTLKTLAQMLNLGEPTISKALRGAADIAPATRERVQKLADELGYAPNLMARSLANKRSFTIGAVVPEILTSHHSYVINGFYEVARQRGYEVLVMVSNESEKNEQHILNYFSSLPVDGILISVTEETSDTRLLERIHERGIPIVFYGRPIETLNFTTVTTDDELSAVKVMEHLLSIGRRTIAFIGPHDILGTTKHIFDGYLKQKKKHNLPHSDDLVQSCKINAKSGHDAMQNILQCEKLPDAVMCANDLIAIGAGQAIIEAGLNIPQDIAIAGIGNILEAGVLLSLPLTTVDHHAENIGQQAVGLLIDQIEDEDAKTKGQTVFLENKLIVRESTVKT